MVDFDSSDAEVTTEDVKPIEIVLKDVVLKLAGWVVAEFKVGLSGVAVNCLEVVSEAITVALMVGVDVCVWRVDWIGVISAGKGVEGVKAGQVGTDVVDDRGE